MKLSDLLKRTPPSPEALEQQKKEKEAYQSSYNKARVQAAHRRGKQAGHTQQGGHGIKATLGTVGKGMGQAGDFGLQMQDNLGNLFGISQPQKKRNKRK